MSEYEAYWLTDFPIGCALRNNYDLSLSQKKNKHEKKLVILQLIGTMVIKCKETRMITYTCRYCSGHLIPIIQLGQDELGIKCPLEYLQV